MYEPVVLETYEVVVVSKNTQGYILGLKSGICIFVVGENARQRHDLP
jgi:hypothetical protein